MTAYEKLTLILSFLTIIVSFLALGFSINNSRKIKQISVYSDLDHLYFDLLKLGIEHPKFVDPEYTHDYQNKFQDYERLQYELYAFMAWNICETIVDRRRDRKLYKSWKPILECENELHRKWFDNPENQSKFKSKFKKFIKKYPQPSKPVNKDRSLP